MNCCFFYGTLKRGHYNNERFSGKLKFVCIGSVYDHALVSQNAYYPHAIELQGGIITGEVFDLDDATLASINSMEFGAGYKIKSVGVRTEHGFIECLMYYSDDQELKNLPTYSTF